MCGIFCTVGDLFKKQDDLIFDMFIMDSLRGLDSCGVIGVANYTSAVDTFKKAVLPLDFLDMKGYDNIIRGKNKVLVGHNRWASKGSINHINAHPFTVGGITGVHNGTLTQQYKLPDAHNFEVDSENIFHAINKIGIEETWSRLVGAAALMWWDATEQTFNFIRNNQRPLWFCYSKDLKQMYAASEKYMLMAALERNKISHWELEELPINTLYSFSVDIKAGKPQDVVRCSTRKLEPYKAPVTMLPLKKQQGSSKKTELLPAGYKDLGERVDFIVDDIHYYTNVTVYDIIDNHTGLGYLVQSYAVNPILDLDDLATGVVHRVTGDSVYVNSATIKMDSVFESELNTDDKEEIEDAIIISESESLDEHANWVGEHLEDQDKEQEVSTMQEAWGTFQDHDCNLCGSPVDRDEGFIITTAGQLFCEVCKTDTLVKDYVTDGSELCNC